MKSIRSYLPRPYHTEKTEMMHVRLPLEIKKELMKIAAQNRWKASQVVRGAILKFIDDEHSKRSA